MMTASFLVITTIVLAYTLWPILGNPSNSDYQQNVNSSNALDELIESKDASIDALVDLEFDHEMGKLDSDDYKTLKHTYRTQAKRVLKDIEENEK